VFLFRKANVQTEVAEIGGLLMQKKIRLLSGVFAVFIVIAIGSYVTIAQNAVTGTWKPA
jgi:hypothetical protein